MKSADYRLAKQIKIKEHESKVMKLLIAVSHEVLSIESPSIRVPVMNTVSKYVKQLDDVVVDGLYKQWAKQSPEDFKDIKIWE